MPDVLEALAEYADAPIGPAEFCELLTVPGFIDRTPIERTHQ